MPDPDGRAVVTAIVARHHEINAALASRDEAVLRSPSRLPGWDRLTIVCHLRYGAMASHRMTVEARAGSPTAFYPDGRAQQRDATLRPTGDETAADVIASLADESRRLDERWRAVSDDDWSIEVTEPEGNRDLGTVSLWTLALLRLTEVEVHGLDLDLGLDPWSDTFVSTVLPMRMAWLTSRRPNPGQADFSIDGVWLLRASDGPSYTVRAVGPRVDVEVVDGGASEESTIIGSQAELLAFILGRLELRSLRVDGDPAAAARFQAAFPGP